MRRNAFGNVYCTTASEIVEEMEKKEVVVTDSYVQIYWDTDADSYGAEILENEDGEVVCYVEGFDSRESLRQTMIQVGFNARAVNYN